MSKRWLPPFRFTALGTAIMAYDLWRISPLYENEDLKVASKPTVSQIDQVSVLHSQIIFFTLVKLWP